MVLIRPASGDDVDEIYHLRSTALRDGGADIYTPEELDALDPDYDSPERYLDLVTSDDYWVLVAEPQRISDSDSSIAGYGVVEPDVGYIHGLFVDPAFQGEQIGSRLLTDLEQLVASYGVADIELRATLNAVPFYENHGYEPLDGSSTLNADGIEIPVRHLIKSIREDTPVNDDQSGS